VRRARLGIAVATTPLPAGVGHALGLDQRTAVVVQSVSPGGAAAAAGLRAGDVLLALGATALTGPDALMGRLTHDAIGRPMPLRLLRAGAPLTLEVTAAEAPAETPRSA
jgi:S1-C subfamily serine protease